MDRNASIAVALALCAGAASRPSAQTTLVSDSFSDGVLDPSWSVSLDQATSWTMSESADPGGTLLEVTDIGGVPAFTWGTVRLDWIVGALEGPFDLSFHCGWNGSGSKMVQVSVLLLDDQQQTIARGTVSDVWLADTSKAVWSCAGGDQSVGGPDGSLPVAGTTSFQFSRDASDVLTVKVAGATKIITPDDRAVRTARITVSGHGTHPYGYASINSIDLSTPGCGATANLSGTPKVLSVSAGGVQDFALSTCPPLPGQTYLLLGTAGDPAPGVVVDGLTLPLTIDPYFNYTLGRPNSAPLADSAGALDAAGAAAASFTLPPALGPTFVGLKLHHAFVTIDVAGAGQLSAASGPAPLVLDP